MSEVVLPVSVVIPAFNRERVIERAIQSVTGQSRAPRQVIVVDDCSTDDTALVAENVVGVTLIRNQRNLGRGPARNAGIKSATQPWVAFLDSDDEWLPDHLETCWRHTDDNVLICDSGQIVGDRSGFYGNPYLAERKLVSPGDVFVPENWVATSGALVRSDVLNSLNGFRDIVRAQDLDLWIRVLECGVGVVLPSIGFRYFVHEDQATADKGRMHDALLDVTGGFVDRDWWSNSLGVAVRSSVVWDRIRSKKPTVADLVWLVRNPSALHAIVRLNQFRRHRVERSLLLEEKPNEKS